MTPTIWCFPFAGASYYSYRPLFKSLEQSHDVKYLELPGRGNRINEQLLFTYQEVLDDIFAQVKEEAREPFILYGHSMGAQLAFDTAQLLISHCKLKPLKLIVSGRGAPAVVKMKRRHDMPKPEFTQALKNLGGIPQEILNDAEFFSFFEPILRADFQAIESYSHVRREPLDIPILALIGDEEETTVDEANAWGEATSVQFGLKVFRGGHFFILEHTESVSKLIADTGR